MEEKMKIKLILGTLASFLIFLGFVFFRVFSVSTKSVMVYPLTFFNDFLTVFSSTGASDAILNSLITPVFFVIPFIPITLAFCVLIFYGLHYGEDRKFCTIICLVPSAVGAVFVGLSVTSLMFLLGMIACGFLVSPLAIMYLRELKKWKRYRIGSRTVSKCFLLINLFLFSALFINVFIDQEIYSDIYRQDAEDFVIGLIPEVGGGGLPQIEGMEILPPEQREQIEEEYSALTADQRQNVENKVTEMLRSENISAMISMSLFFMPFMVFAILEMLRMLVLDPVAGLVTRTIFRKIKP